MENFYDLNDFIAYIVRKLKLVIFIVCIATVGFSGIRFKNLYATYRSQHNQQTEEMQEKIASEPMKCWSEINLNIGPNYEVIGTTGMDRGDEIADAYNALKNDDIIMKTLHDSYFEQAKIYGDQMRQLMSQYGYILDKEKNYEYAEYDFRKQFSVQVNDNYVTIGFYSLNEEFSKEVVADYEKMLTERVEKQFPNFDYSKISDAIRYELPDISAGASPTRNARSGSTSTSKMSWKSVIVQTIKGCVWGIVIGIVAALVIVFFMYMMSRKIIIWRQLQFVDIRTYGLLYSKKGGFIKKAIRRMIAMLEGNKTAFSDFNTLADVILADVHMRFNDDRKIAICSCADEKNGKILCKYLNANEGKDRFVHVPSLLIAGKEYPKGVNEVILIEIIGKTVNSEIEQEIKTLRKYDIEILGVVGVE